MDKNKTAVIIKTHHKQLLFS